LAPTGPALTGMGSKTSVKSYLKTSGAVILNLVKDLKFLQIRDYLLRSE